jgi:beta-N-acetylhexosaminidase
MVMVGFRGTDVAGAGPVVEQVRAGQVGGVVLYDSDVLTRGPRNVASPAQLRDLVAGLQAVAPVPLLVAVDQEGGQVSRLREQHGFPATESQRDLGRQGSPARTRAHARAIAAMLAGVGVNLNLAPVVDLDVNPASPAIGALGRSYSADPEVVTAHARAAIQGHHDEGVLTALKHFPGHGSAEADSHLGFADVTGTWSAAELAPYRDLVAGGVADVVMTAHVFNRHLDPQWPATLSPATVGGLLRDEIGHRGVVLSDDLQMGAIADHYDLRTAIRQAVLAGVDVLVFSNNNQRGYDPAIGPRAVEALASLVADGTVPERRIDESAERIRALKARIRP